MTTTNIDMFEMANRMKFRFPFKGMINSEDLFDLNVKELDLIFKKLNSELKKVKEESLLEVKTQQDKELEIKIEIVKYIFNIKREEEQKRLKAKELKEKKQRLMEILKGKEEQDLLDKSTEDIQKMINELES